MTDDEIGEPITDAQLVHHFDQRAALLQSMVDGMVPEVAGEPPLVSAVNLPLFCDYIRDCPGDLHAGAVLELLAISVMRLAEQQRHT